MIHGNLVTLRAVQPEDLLNWVKWFNDRAVTEYLARVYPYSQADAEKYWQKTQQNPQEILYSIVNSSNGEHIGSINLRNIDWRSRNSELGVLLGAKECWGKGYGRDAVRTMCQFAFKELGLVRVYLYVRADHPSGIRSYSKVGFKQEGIARKQLYRNGVYHDMVLMGLLADELD
ncbi:MAG TPA: GNAT family protein [Chloroflexia bacterium]|nr:GNAT family protein [Chloroflexia bacterium]